MKQERETNGKHQTWLVWDRMTASLMLEVQRVPVKVSERTICMALFKFGYWPFEMNEFEQNHDYIELNTLADAPAVIRNQWSHQSIRHIEWRELWAESTESSAR